MSSPACLGLADRRSRDHCGRGLSIFIGVILGLVSGYIGGWLDRTLVVIADAIYAFPPLPWPSSWPSSSAAAVQPLGGILAAAISITVVFIPQYFRVRAETIRLKAEPFVESPRWWAPRTSGSCASTSKNATRRCP